MNNELRDRVKEWLAEAGHPFEMFAARSLRNAGFQPVQGFMYRDPQSDRLREIDLMAVVPIFEGLNALLLTLAIECKVSRAKPWVLFTAPNTSGPSWSAHSRSASSKGTQLLASLTSEGLTDSIPILAAPDRVAYGIVQALGPSHGEDPSYVACLQAVKAVSSYAQSIDDMNEQVGAKHGVVNVQLGFPAVILDGALFEAYLTESGELTIEQVERGTLFFRAPFNANDALVHVLTRQSLDEFARMAFESFGAIAAAVRGRLPLLLDPLGPAREGDH